MHLKKLLLLYVLVTPAALFAEEKALLQEITVQHGDTLWSVANKYLKDPKKWPEIIKYNRLSSSDPNIILPGMSLKVPVLLIKEHLRYAHLISMLNDVRYRRTNEVAFNKARLNIKLYHDDAIRTFKNSQAQVKFYSGELLRIDQNSFIIIRPEQQGDEVRLLAGAVRASRSRVIAADTVVMPKITPKMAETDFKTHLRKDKTTLVEVYKGIVDVTAQGKTVTLTKGFGTEVKYLRAPSPPKKLPPLPEMLSESLPGTEIVARTSLVGGQLMINLKPPDSSSESYGKAKVLGQLINKYHLQIAAEKDFKKVVFNETNLIGKKLIINFSDKNIKDGIYFYRIAYVDELGFEGNFTNPTRFTIDRIPPVLMISHPEEGAFIETEFITIVGKTEPGCYVKVNDKVISVNRDGSFQTIISSKKREVVIDISSSDAYKNKTNLKRTFIFMRGRTGEESILKKPANILMGIATISLIIGVVALIF